jgi:hypothetical protein
MKNNAAAKKSDAVNRALRRMGRIGILAGQQNSHHAAA